MRFNIILLLCYEYEIFECFTFWLILFSRFVGYGKCFEPRSIDSSFNQLNIPDDELEDAINCSQQHIESPTLPYDEDTVSLTPLINNMFLPKSELPTLDLPLLSVL